MLISPFIFKFFVCSVLLYVIIVQSCLTLNVYKVKLNLSKINAVKLHWTNEILWFFLIVVSPMYQISFLITCVSFLCLQYIFVSLTIYQSLVNRNTILVVIKIYLLAHQRNLTDKSQTGSYIKLTNLITAHVIYYEFKLHFFIFSFQ